MNTNHSSGLLASLLLPVFLLICLLLGQSAQAYHTQDDAADRFYNALAPYGNWVHHRSYGRVWYPRHVPRDWRPYTDGYWSYTSNYGWLWVSDWVWGWAPFHYGRWVWDNWYGWVWVPGTLWAPAWVFWRYGGGYLSWAPMPPHYIWNPYVSYSTFYFDYDRYVNWDSWVFVHERDFPRRHRPRRLIAPDRNQELLKSTQSANNITVINNNIVNQGIPVNHIEQVTGRRIKPEAPKVMTHSDWIKEDRRRGRTTQEAIIYRPIDVKPTPDIVRQQEQHARQFSERLAEQPPSTIQRSRPEQERLPRVPGRLSGKPVPLDYVESQEPTAIPPQTQQPAEPLWNLPGRGESVPLGPRGGRTLPQERFIDKDRGLELQQQDLERQQRAEEERLQGESALQQKEEHRRQLDQERRLIEQERLYRESARPQVETSRRQQLEELERQRQDEQRRMEQESGSRQEQLYRQQRNELQQQIEQQRRARDAARQIEELNRQQEQLYRQPRNQRQQPMELQEQPDDAQSMRGGLRPQRETIQQPITEPPPSIQQPTDGQMQPDQGGRGRSGRSLSRSQRSR